MTRFIVIDIPATPENRRTIIKVTPSIEHYSIAELLETLAFDLENNPWLDRGRASIARDLSTRKMAINDRIFPGKEQSIPEPLPTTAIVVELPYDAVLLEPGNFACFMHFEGQ